MQDKKQSPNFAATNNGASDKESSTYSNKSRSYTQGSQNHVDDIARALSALNHLKSGRPYDEWMKIGMAAKSAGISFEDFNAWSASGYNYKSQEACRKFWDGINESGGISAGTLFHLAIESGWKDSGVRYFGRDVRAKAKPIIDGVDVVENVRAMKIWDACVPATGDESYIVRKQGSPNGLRVYPPTAQTLIICKQNIAGYLVLPCWSNGILQTLQFISPEKGKKLNLNGTTFNDGYFVVGEIADKIYLCEGIGQAWAANKSTNVASVVCFGVGRMNRVARVLREKYPKTKIIVVSDKGMEKEAAETAALVNGLSVEMPDDKPERYDANDYLEEFGVSALADLLEQVKTSLLHYKLLSGADLLKLAPIGWVIDGVIPVEGLASLYGPSGCGKTFLLLDMGCSVAEGVEKWFGLPVKQTFVTYVCLEGEAGIGKRVKAWSEYHKRPLPDSIRFITQPFNLMSMDVEELAKAVIAANGAGGLVILDTLNRAAPGADENSSVDMGNIIAAAKKLQVLIGGLVLLVHHTGKDTTKGLRGHSSLYAALDGAIEVSKSNERREWSVAKSKDDVTGRVFPFELKVVSVGQNNRGEEVTSCVVITNNSVDDSKRRILLPPKSGNQRVIWNALVALFRMTPRQNNFVVPVDKPCLRLDDAIAKTRIHLVEAKEKRRTERTQAAIRSLIERGLLGHLDGWIWEA